MDPENGGLVVLEDEYHVFNSKTDLQSVPNDMIGRINDKLIEIVESEPFKFKTVVLKLILAQEYAFLKNYEDSFKTLDTLEVEMKSLMKIKCDCFLFDKISKAFVAILKTCKAFVLIKQNNEEKAREIVRTVISFNNLDRANQASVYGIRSMMFMEYGLYGHKMALEDAEKANKMDPENSYWHFLIGKALGRIRRVEKPYDIPSDEERNALKKAISMNEHYLFMLFTAESYVETSSRTYRFHVRNCSLYPTLKVSIDQMNEEASNLYKKCIEKEPNCSHVLFRAARGFLNLPYPQRDPDRAKKLLMKGLKTNQRNPFANHLLARYYERFAHNIPKAIEHLEICTEQQVFGAEMDLMRLQFTQNGVRIKPVEKLERLLTIYNEAPRQIQILTQLASYYIFIEPDLTKASKLLKEAITVNCDDNITNHRSIFLRVRQPFSILDVLVDEIKIKMDGNCNKDEKKIYEAFIFDLTDSNVKIPTGRAKNLKSELLIEDKETRLGNYYKKPTNTHGNSQFRRRSYSRPTPQPAPRSRIQKAHSVQQVDDFFDAWTQDGKKDRKQNGLSKTNTSSKSSLNDDVSPASDSRFSKSNGRYDRHPRNNTDADAQFDRLGTASISRDRPKQYENGDFKKPQTRSDDIADDFDRLSVSSNRSTLSTLSRGRGRASYGSSRLFQDQGDFDKQPTGRGRARRTDFNDDRGNGNAAPRGRGILSQSENDRTNNSSFARNEPNIQNMTDKPSFDGSPSKVTNRPESRSAEKNRNSEYYSDKSTSDGLPSKNAQNTAKSAQKDRKPTAQPQSTLDPVSKSQNSKSVRDESNSDNASSNKTNSKDSRLKPTDEPVSSRSTDHRNISKSGPTKRNPESTSFKNWREKNSNKKEDNLKNREESSDSDDDLMSYFRKK